MKKKSFKLQRPADKPYDDIPSDPSEYSPDEELVRAIPISADMKKAALLITADQARYLVDRYYQVQRDRLRANAQLRESATAKEPTAFIDWMADVSIGSEKTLKAALAIYADRTPAGRWAQSNYGIGPVLAAGLLAHIDIHKAPTVGHIWSFAGLNPTTVWKPNTRRPWNAQLKTLCWKIGQSFMKFHNNEKCLYGHLYAERKAEEIAKNEAGLFHEQAAESLADKTWKDKASPTYLAYQAGKLPDGRIELRAERYAVKIFLAHFHHVLYEETFGMPPPFPYILTQPGHAHYIAPPNWPIKLSKAV